MKHFLIIALLLAFSKSYSQDKAKLYFIRNSGKSGSFGVKVEVDDSAICKVKGKRFFIHEVLPGIHKVDLKIYNKANFPIELNAEAGRTYYFWQTQRKKKLLTYLAWVEVAESTAKEMMLTIKEQRDCN